MAFKMMAVAGMLLWSWVEPAGLLCWTAQPHSLPLAGTQASTAWDASSLGSYLKSGDSIQG